jgi:hypothetical protein
MPEEPDTPCVSTVYQLRVVLREISPIIWRRLLVSGDTTLASLHDILQIAFGWSGEHLHRFVVHGADYDAIHGDNLAQVSLAELGLRATERFVYDYNFTDFWRHDLRVEAILAAEHGRRYPRCTGGRRAGPPEECGGPWAFMERSQPYRVFEVICRAAEIVGILIDDMPLLGEHRAELAALYPWMNLYSFDRRELNRALAGLGRIEGRAA